MRGERGTWIYWVPPLALMAIFTILAVTAVIGHAWWWVLVGVLGTAISAGLWITIQQLREAVTLLTRSRVQDRYKIGELEAALRRARTWQN